MNYKDRKIIELAQTFGYRTAKELAKFLRVYNPSIRMNERGDKFIYLAV